VPEAISKAPAPSPKATSSSAEVEATPVMPTATPPKPQSPLADTAIYYLVHAGSYGMEASAKSRVEALRQHGFVSYLFHKETAAGSYHVVAGKYSSRQEAKAASAQLAALGIESYISESNQRRGDQIPPTQPEAATVSSVSSPAKSSPQAAAPSIYRIMAGSYFTDSDARRQVETLQQSGFSSYMFQKETPSGRSFHVVAGKFINRPDAETAMTRLKALGIDHYLSEGK
jgi:cell division septation protein DedD